MTLPMKGVFPVVRWFLEQETWRIPEIFPASRDAAGLWREAELLGVPTPLATGLRASASAQRTAITGSGSDIEERTIGKRRGGTPYTLFANLERLRIV